MVHKVLKIDNEDGLRSKSAAMFVQEASKFQSQIIIEKGNKKVNAKSIMGLLSLGVNEGESIHVIANGDDEKEALAALASLVKDCFLRD